VSFSAAKEELMARKPAASRAEILKAVIFLVPGLDL
jgi:hypothetical protein